MVPDRHRGYRGALCPALRRVDGVRLYVGGEHAHAEVFGIGHRHPVTLPVSLALASRLVGAGAPLEVRPEHAAEAARD